MKPTGGGGGGRGAGRRYASILEPLFGFMLDHKSEPEGTSTLAAVERVATDNAATTPSSPWR